MKTKTDMDARILLVADPVADDLGYTIVRIRVMSSKRSTVQIMAERKSDGLMGVDDCAILSRALSSALEVDDPLRDAYILEVSSPGLDRPLTSLADFENFDGHLARLELDRMMEGRKRFRGVLAGIDGNLVDIDLDGEDETAQIPFDWISEAKLLITDTLIEAGQKALAATKNTPDSDNNTDSQTTDMET
ncbi:MAG: ribosome maturation factor RimP [Alphaproteobacteria bacterium]